MGRRAPAIAAMGRIERLEVQLRHGVEHEPSQVVVRQPPRKLGGNSNSWSRSQGRKFCGMSPTSPYKRTEKSVRSKLRSASMEPQERRYSQRMRMNLWTGPLVILGSLLFFVGWGPVLVSGHGGNSSGGSEAVWTVSGLMVYASITAFVIAGTCQLIARWGSHLRWSGKRP